LEAEYTNVYGNSTDSLIQMFFPDGADTVVSHVIFEIAEVTYDSGCYAGLDDLNEFDVRVYPNPTSGVVTIDGLKTNAQIVVCNSLGQEVLESNLKSRKTNLDLSSLPDGLYIIRTETENGITAKKVQKTD
jgi:hypothetical protein